MYHTGTGDTHLLNPAAWAGLQAVSQSPADLETITRFVARTLRVEPNANLRDELTVLMFDLARLNLVEPARTSESP